MKKSYLVLCVDIDSWTWFVPSFLVPLLFLSAEVFVLFLKVPVLQKIEGDDYEQNKIECSILCHHQTFLETNTKS